MADYESAFTQALDDPEAFWKEQAERIAWYKFPQQILSKDANDKDCWFADGELNTVYLALDHHVEEGRGNDIALIYDSPVTDTVQRYSFLELLDEVARFAGVLVSLGVTQGDRVVIYLPMIQQVLIRMLACASIGAIHSAVLGGFAARELANRIDDAESKVLLTSSCGIAFANVIAYKPLMDKAPCTGIA